MTAADMKEMLGDLPIEAHAPRPKKQKVIEKRPEGVTRELFALFGERAPPIAILDTRTKGRPKFSSRQKVHAWERKPFTNPARDDGLVLRHWQKKQDTGITALATPADSNVASEIDTDEKDKEGKTEPGYSYAKFNIKVTVPEYTDEQYESHLKSDDWSKEETNYLVNLAQDYDLRWIVIGDRYDYQVPSPTQGGNTESTDLPAAPKERTMEDLKARYYHVAAKTMALKQPLQSMSSVEFALHEKMLKFDATLETTRKKLAQTLFLRSPEEVKEEEILLAELKRIVTHQEKFSQERKELYDRLQSPPSASGSTAMYKTSQDLLKLMQDLLSADKNKKRRSLPAEGSSGVPNGPNTGNPERGGPRSSIGGAGTDKRASLSAGAGQNSGTKQLTPREEAKYGIAHLERTSTGTTFRHERINNLAKAKSNALTQKMTQALQELGIPVRLTMPTARVCDEFEKLVGSIHTLLEVRKVSEKLEGEIKVARAQIEEKEGGGDGAGDEAKIEAGVAEKEVEDDEGEEDAEGEDNDEAENDDEDQPDAEDKVDVENEVEGNDEAEDDEDEEQEEDEQAAVADSDDSEAEPPEPVSEEPEPGIEQDEQAEAPPARGNSVRKRSASVVSHLSSKSNRSTKRQKK